MNQFPRLHLSALPFVSSPFFSMSRNAPSANPFSPPASTPLKRCHVACPRCGTPTMPTRMQWLQEKSTRLGFGALLPTSWKKHAATDALPPAHARSTGQERLGDGRTPLFIPKREERVASHTALLAREGLLRPAVAGNKRSQTRSTQGCHSEVPATSSSSEDFWHTAHVHLWPRLLKLLKL